jgi:hypothetical protein
MIPERMAKDALRWAEGRLAMGDVLIRPPLDGNLLTISDSEMKEKITSL